MKKWYAISDGNVYAVSVYAKSKREAIRKYRALFGLERVHCHATAWLADDSWMNKE